MRRPAQAPLTFGQASVWRSLEQLPERLRTSANLVRVWAVPSGGTVELVRVALTALEARHESLRTRFRNAGSLRQVVYDLEPIEWQVVDASAGEESAVAETVAAIGRDAFLLDSARPWRATLLTSQGRPYALVVCLHHIAADLWSLNQLGREFEDLVRGEPVPPGPVTNCREIAEIQRSETWSGQRKATIDYWRDVLRKAPPPDGGLVAAGNVTKWATLRCQALGSAAASLAAEWKVSGPSVLLAAYCREIAERSGERDVLVALAAANRTVARWRPVVSSFNQLAPVLVRIDPDESLEALSRRVHWRAVRAYRHSCYDVDDLAALRYGHGRDGLGHGFRYHFSSVTEPVPSDRQGEGVEQADDHRITTRSTGRDNGFPCYFLADAGRGYFTLRESTPGEDFGAMRQFLDDICARLTRPGACRGGGRSR